MLTAHDIRYARTVDLAALTGFDSSNFAAWFNRRGLSERNRAIIAQRLGMDQFEFLKGLELRRQDMAIAREVQAKLEAIISSRKEAVSA
ncbi:MAG: hypothetical protein LH702_05340 [Phormidesmis sp. CAN_BIN44]|nr:hypothetical protein [Phormidesmis sp. CAN_BIN44]